VLAEESSALTGVLAPFPGCLPHSGDWAFLVDKVGQTKSVVEWRTEILVRNSALRERRRLRGANAEGTPGAEGTSTAMPRDYHLKSDGNDPAIAPEPKAAGSESKYIWAFDLGTASIGEAAANQFRQT